MPELPEVETVVRDLRAHGLEGRTVVRARVHWARSVGTPSATAFCKGLRGARVAGVRRRGKFIVMDLVDSRSVLVHLRMTGRLFFAPAASAREVHQHVIVDLDDGRSLRFRDTRKFGRWYLLPDAQSKLGGLGPEPLDKRFTAAHFVRRLRPRRGMLKPLLLNQAVIAGLGNIYVDEALFEARLHPERRCATLTDKDLRRLYRAVRKVLRRGVRAMGTSLGRAQTNFYSVAGRRGRNQDRLKVFRRHGEPCPVCGTAIERILVCQRSTHFCPQCQPTQRP